MKIATKLLLVTLFTTNAVFYLFRSGNNNIGGDEVASYISVAPFLHALFEGKFLPTFLVFFHEPLFQLASLPFVFLGASELWVRFPNIVSGILLFVVLYKMGKILFGKENLYVIILLSIYTFNGFTLSFRTGINIGLFNLLLATSAYYLTRFSRKNGKTDFYSAFKLFLVNFFVYIDAVFTFPGFLLAWLYSKIKNKLEPDRNIIIPALSATIIFILWMIGVYLGSLYSGAYDWRMQAPARLFMRGTSYSISSVFDNIRLLTSDNSLEFVVMIIGFTIISLFDKRARVIWGLLAGPLVFLNLVKMPTVHPLFFISLVMVAAVLGIRTVVERFPVTKYFILIFLCLGLVKNVQNVVWANPTDADRDFKVAATFLRKITPLCEKVYIKTSSDGHVFRFYFNRGYSTEITPDVNVGFVDGNSPYPELNGFGKIAEVNRPDRDSLSIYQKGYKGSVSELNYMDAKLFQFPEMLTYINKCYQR